VLGVEPLASEVGGYRILIEKGAAVRGGLP
jgi:hypothetical protein